MLRTRTPAGRWAVAFSQRGAWFGGRVECFSSDDQGRSLVNARYGPSGNVFLETAVDEKTGGAVPPTVGIIMGSDSDWKTMRPAAQVLGELGVSCETKV